MSYRLPLRWAMPAALVLAVHTITAAPQPPSQSAWMDLARTPPMGWNSWNRFQCDVSDALVRQTADAMVSSGMRDAGYRYIVIDDCWQVSREANGTIVADPQRFPNGMKALADYVHSKGLRFGLYSDAGSKTCQGRPGSNGYELEDARQYAAWGVDYLKYDWCSTDGVEPKIEYTTMRDALRSTGRPIVFSMCEWGKSSPSTWARGVAHLWRTTTDILPCWECTKPWGGLGWPSILDLQVGLDKYAGPGGWNDPDMLQVGNPGLTIGESRAHFSFWALLAAPLIAGNDIRSMAPDVRDILLNREVIAVDQDSLGREGHKVRDDGDREVWAKPLDGGAQAVILFNRGTDAASVSVSWHELGLSDDAQLHVRDLWQHKDLGVVSGTFTARVPSHEVVMLRVSSAG
ncbi:MAG TPA: alpha-galactosidase [Vicinamibacterales bacterium]|nr:alpha-galactosidase [Vicinamibacterales bacterium]